MYIITANGKPEYYISTKGKAIKACRKSNHNGKDVWEAHRVRPLPDVDLVMTAKTWDRIRCCCCGAIFNTDGHLVQLSGKSMDVHFSDYSRIVESLSRMRDLHKRNKESSADQVEKSFYAFAVKLIQQIIDTVQGAMKNNKKELQ